MSARLYLTDLKDTSVSEGGATIAAIKHVIDETAATTIYTHTAHDVHQDHRNVHRATLVAARKTPRVYCYQSPSTNIDFRPTRFVGIDEFLERKLEVIQAYASRWRCAPTSMRRCCARRRATGRASRSTLRGAARGRA